MPYLKAKKEARPRCGHTGCRACQSPLSVHPAVTLGRMRCMNLRCTHRLAPNGSELLEGQPVCVVPPSSTHPSIHPSVHPFLLPSIPVTPLTTPGSLACSAASPAANTGTNSTSARRPQPRRKLNLTPSKHWPPGGALSPPRHPRVSARRCPPGIPRCFSCHPLPLPAGSEWGKITDLCQSASAIRNNN